MTHAVSSCLAPLQYLVLLTGTSGFWNTIYLELQILHHGYTWHLLFSCSHATGPSSNLIWRLTVSSKACSPRLVCVPSLLLANKDRGRAEGRRPELFHKDLDVSGRECCCLPEILTVLARSEAQGFRSDGLQCSCLAFPDEMVSQLNHLVVCLRPHVLLPQMCLKDPLLLSSYYIKGSRHTHQLYIHIQIYFQVSFCSRFFNLNCGPCELSMLRSAHYPQGQLRGGTWHSEESKVCTKKLPHSKEAPETKGLNYVPVGWCSR